MTRRAHAGAPARALSKLGSPGGYTLVEALTALLIVVMLTCVVSAGLPTALSTYRKAVDASNAQAALSTATSKLRDELAYATDVAVSDGSRVVSYTDADGRRAAITATGGALSKAFYSGGPDGDGQLMGERALLPPSSAPDGAGFAFSEGGGVYYSDGAFTVSGLRVERAGDVLATTGEAPGGYKIRSLA